MSDNNVNTLKSAQQDIAFVRRRLKGLVESEDVHTVFGDDFVEGLKKWQALIDKKSDEPFTLVVLGDFKRGKSTIINALLGKQLAPVNAAPETYTINEISYGETPSVEAVLLNGDRIPLDITEITREKIEPLMTAFPDKIDYLDIRDDSELLKEVRIVDTPGLSDLDDLDKKVSEYLVNADAIIYVASALLPFSETEQMFLMSHVQPQRFGMLYVLVNMIDALSNKEDVDKIMNRITEKSEAVVPNAITFGISGQDEYNRKTGNFRTNKEFEEFYENQFLNFEVSLKRDIIMQKDVIKTRRVIALLEQMLNETFAKVRMYEEMTALDNQKLVDITKEFEEKCESISAALQAKKPVFHLSIVEMQQEAERWMYEFFAKLRESVLECRNAGSEESDISTQDVEKYFYSYLMDKVGEAYRKCIETHRDRINELVDGMSEQLSRSLGIKDLSTASKSTSVDKVMSDLKNKVTRQVMGVKLYGTSETFPSATMSSFTSILKKKKQIDIIDIALENYDDIRTKTVKDIKEAYADIEVKAEQRLDSIYQSQIEIGKETLERASNMVKTCDPDALVSAFGVIKKAMEESNIVLTKYGVVIE
ncbi:MAG: hypothetical protein E7509_05135 [Ruminococcus sp.]|nr:hypothetical protein [Ruminococcus sp.]